MYPFSDVEVRVLSSANGIVMPLKLCIDNAMIRKPKFVLKPFQEVLLGKGVCPGCMKPLSGAEVIVHDYKPGVDVLQCKCRRRFTHDKKKNRYKRLSLESEKALLTNRKK